MAGTDVSRHCRSQCVSRTHSEIESDLMPTSKLMSAQQQPVCAGGEAQAGRE
jgi:hypothetical protein